MKMFNKVSVGVLLSLSIVGVGLSLRSVFAAGGSAVNLGSSGNFAVLSKTGISTTGATSIIGDIGLSPAAASYITGFALTLPDASATASSSQVVGKVYAPGYQNPTPAYITTAVGDMENAYTDASSRAPNVTELGAGNIGGLTLVPGVYKWGTGVTIPTDVTLSGGANDVWIFQIAQNLDISSSAKVILSGGADPRNIFWIVAGQTTLGTTSVFNGNILDQTAIVLNTGAVLNGRALAQTAVTLDSNTVNIPSGTSVVYTPIVIPTPIQISNSSSSSSSNSSSGNYTVSVSPTTTNTGVITISYNFGTSTLKQGSRGNAVMELQRFLNQVLKTNTTVDGKLGKNTISLVKKWQKDHGLVADGIIGVKTKAKMNSTVL